MTSPTEARNRLLAYADALGLAPQEGLALALAALDKAADLPGAMAALFALLRQKNLSVEAAQEPLAATPPLNRQSMIAEKKRHATI